jgi:hypothetical protein
VTRFNLIAFACVSSLFTGCYMSHERPSDAEVEMPPPAPTCAPESSDPIARYEVLMADDVEIEAGTRRAEIMSVSLRGLNGSDLEFAEYLYRFEAVMGSLTAPDGGAVFTNARLRVSGRSSLFGPYDIIAAGEEVVEGEFWDANILRAGDEVVLTLEVDVAEGVEGIYEVRLGDECDLTSRMWTVPEDGPTVEMSADLIDDEPITVIVTVVPHS